MKTGEDAIATYRLQIHGEFPLERAEGLAAYLVRLGVTHVYTSPLLQARAGSTHGYDLVDPRIINPEIGGESALASLSASLGRYGMGIVMDYVPNHMAACFENPYWRDVLTYGRSSPFAGFFDIDWRSPTLEMVGRVLLPVLRAPIEQTLDKDELQVHWHDGRFLVCYGDQFFPVDPKSVPLICHDAFRGGVGGDQELEAVRNARLILKRLRGLPSVGARLRKDARVDREEIEQLLSEFARLVLQSPVLKNRVDDAVGSFIEPAMGRVRMRQLLARQPYRLVHWRRASSAINYRRFFAINELVSVRQEDPLVFEATHAALIRLVGDGLIHGLRVDHIDGLRDPAQYLQRLDEALEQHRCAGGHFPVYVEKILAPKENLCREWPVAGTTGYDFLNEVERLFVSSDGYNQIRAFYGSMMRRMRPFTEVALEAKRNMLRNDFSVFVDRLAGSVVSLGERLRATPEFGWAASCPSKREAAVALQEWIAALPCYRTYASPKRVWFDSQEDRQVREALRVAEMEGRGSKDALALLALILLGDGADSWPDGLRQERIAFVARLQQLCGPAAAKGIEDTALYIYIPLVSLNEVGGSPDEPLDDAIARLHIGNEERSRNWPLAMLAVTTHDTKRTADVRARLDVLSEVPGEWWRRVQRWRRWHRGLCRPIGGGRAPDGNLQYLFYQTVVGVWPVMGGGISEQDLTKVCERLEIYLIKAAREAKARTSWERPNKAYEAGVQAFVREALEHDSTFVRDVSKFVGRISLCGYWNSLARTVIQFVSPGSPDLYQGDEMWNLALVDPDNRREVDFEKRDCLLQDILREIEEAGEARGQWLSGLLETISDGRMKLYTIHCLLRTRRKYPQLFADGSYEALVPEGARAGNLFCFLRQVEDESLLVLVPRMTMELTGGGRAPVGAEVWDDDDVVALPESVVDQVWESVFACKEVVASVGRFRVSQLLEDFPVCCLVGKRSPL